MVIGNCELAKRIGASAADMAPIKLRTEVLFLSPAQISPDPGQPRQEFDEEGLDHLAHSLKKYGQLQPVLVRQERGKYILVAGERRWRAAKLAGMKTIQALLCKGGDFRSIQLVENLLREDLKPVEQARAFHAIMKKENWSARELAKQLSLEQSKVAKTLRLLKLDEEIQEMVDAGEIPHTTAYEISKQPAGEQIKLAKAAAAGTIKGDDLRRPKPTRPLTLGGPAPWTFRLNGAQVTVSGHRDHADFVALLEAALAKARRANRPLAGGLGRR
jgi:ParB family chromosome partitioning protein